MIAYRKANEFAKQTWTVDMHRISAFLISQLFWSVMGFQLGFIGESLKYFYMWKEWRAKGWEGGEGEGEGVEGGKREEEKRKEEEGREGEKGREIVRKEKDESRYG